MISNAASSTAAESRRIGAFGALLILGFALAACGSISEQTAATAFVAPGRYNIYTCKDIEARLRAAQARAVELEQLMARAAQGAGGQFINAIAYQSEHLQTRGQIKALTDTIAEKNCTSQSQWSSKRSVF